MQWLYADQKRGRMQPVVGFEFLIENGRLSPALIHFWPGNAIRVKSKKTLPLNQWTHVGLTYNGSSRASPV